MPGIHDWLQFGIAGAALGGMFVLVFFVIKLHKEERKEWKDTARDERNVWRASIKADRDEWKQATITAIEKQELQAQRRDDKMEVVIKDLTEAVRAISHKPRKLE